MSKIAIIKTGGKQYKVQVGDTLKVEKLDVEAGKNVKLDTLLIADGANLEIGRPSLGDKVEAEVVGAGKGDKVTVVKYKSKTRYKRTVGHRQRYTELKVTKIA